LSFGRTNLLQAESYYRQTLQYQRKLIGPQSAEVAATLRGLSAVLCAEDKLPEAEAAQREAVAIDRRLNGAGGADLGASLGTLGLLLQREGKSSEAEAAFRQALDDLRAGAAKEPARVSSELGVVLHHLAMLRADQNALAEARSLAEEAASLYRRHPEWPPAERSHAISVLWSVLKKSHATDKKSLATLESLSRSPSEVGEEGNIPARASLLCLWKLDGNALDSVGTNNGALVGPISATAGVAGQALRFNGTNTSVQIANGPAPRNFSIAVWARFDSMTSRSTWAGLQYIVFRKNSRDANFEGFSLAKKKVEGVERLSFEMTSKDGYNSIVFSTNTVAPGVFYHLVATFDGRWARLYVNGVEHGADYHPYPADYGPRPLFFGASGELYEGRLAGTLDEISIYDGALSAQQVNALYEKAGTGR
jgi:tetratricopeptide (TPR) repeat protein